MSESAPLSESGRDAQSPSAATSSTDMSAVLLDVVRELSEQRKTLRDEQRSVAAERKSELRWKRVFQLLIFGTPLLLGLLYFMVFVSTTSVDLGPVNEVVGVIKISGQIGPGQRASADKIIPSLEKAFADTKVKAIVLSIDSPGGSPTESEAINNSIAVLKKRHNKEIIAVISNVGASAAYMIAARTDKVFAGRYSLVGSIGAILTAWDVHRLAERIEVEQRVFASGALKSLLNPFQASTPAADAKALEIVTTMGGEFMDLVRATRGAKLKEGFDYATGEVWGGNKALEIGLIDGIGTLDQVIADTWGLKAYDFSPSKERLSFLSAAIEQAVTSAVDRVLFHSVSIR